MSLSSLFCQPATYPSLSRSRHHNLTSSSRHSTPKLSLVLAPACPFLGAWVSLFGTTPTSRLIFSVRYSDISTLDSFKFFSP
ncbi:hypothetical protein BDR03DRAFT_956437 [Suillus americanus]|nr:hypothetical protein BDR03DRAFT_956437 [Suillus americanus]